MRNDTPIIQRTIHLRWRDPRKVIALHPFELPLVMSLALVAIVFTFWPEALEHSPISFEQRGPIHHIWHYSLLFGSLLALWGLFYAGRRRTLVELVGLAILWGALMLNFVALLAGTTVLIDPAGQRDILRGTGLGMALRLAILGGLGVRIWLLITEKTIVMPVNPERRVDDG